MADEAGVEHLVHRVPVVARVLADLPDAIAVRDVVVAHGVFPETRVVLRRMAGRSIAACASARNRYSGRRERGAFGTHSEFAARRCSVRHAEISAALLADLDTLVDGNPNTKWIEMYASAN